METAKIRDFTDLFAWKKGHELVLLVYKLTKNFPADEKLGLTSQIRRAVVSITSNIAEGFSRRSSKEKSHFYSMSAGSLTEVQNQLLIARDVGYLASEDFEKAMTIAHESHRILNGLISSTKTF